jgi:glycosyltransferase involved in cell wall biosynthesis
MKVAVYTIALNEEQFVKRWYESAKDADFLLIADTGSTDKTVETATELGITVGRISIKPWRFDDARNASLALIPADIDYCIALDMDEILLPGWKQELEKAFEAKATRPRYKYTWSWNEDGSPGLQYGGDKIHSRHGYRWKHPVHEVMMADRITPTEYWTNLEIHHHPDNAKSRSQYMPLLKQSVKEDPNDDRNAFYYARELFFYGQVEESYKEFERHLSLPTAVWKPERAASMRYLAKLSESLSDRLSWLHKAHEECPDRREPLVDIAQAYYENNVWKACLNAAEKALEIKTKPLEYLCEEFAWGSAPWDFAAIAAYRLGKFDKAIQYGTKAVELNPNDPRLTANLAFYLKEQSLGNII